MTNESLNEEPTTSKRVRIVAHPDYRPPGVKRIKPGSLVSRRPRKQEYKHKKGALRIITAKSGIHRKPGKH